MLLKPDGISVGLFSLKKKLKKAARKRACHVGLLRCVVLIKLRYCCATLRKSGKWKVDPSLVDLSQKNIHNETRVWRLLPC